MVGTGRFYGMNSTNITIPIPGATTYGFTTCVVASKLDGSASPLSIEVPHSNSGNQTSIPFGSTTFCEENIVV